MLGQKQFPVHPGPHFLLVEGQKYSHLAHLDLAQPSIILSSRTGTLWPGFLICALVQKQHPTCLQARRGRNFLLNFPDHCLRLPRRIGHELLQVLPIFHRVTDPPGNVGIISSGLHLQKSSQVGPGMLRTISGLRLETASIPTPDVLQTASQTTDRVFAQPPAVWKKESFLNYSAHRYRPPIHSWI